MKTILDNILNRGLPLRIAVGITVLALLLSAGAGATSDSETQAFLTLINDHRAQNDLGLLSVDQLLQASANWMSDDMLNNCVAGRYTCSHTDSTGRTFDKRLLDFGYPVGRTSAGENIAWGYNGGMTTAQRAFNAWKNSPGHNANMLSSSFTAIGISRSCNAGDCAWVTDFGGKVVKPVDATPTPSVTPTPTPTPTVTRTPTPTPSVAPTPIPSSEGGSISGYTIHDTNGNGIWDAGEGGLSGWNIGLIGASNAGIVVRKDTSTDSRGFFRFYDLPAGKYSVVEKLMRGYSPTGPSIKRIQLAEGDVSTNNIFTVIRQ